MQSVSRIAGRAPVRCRVCGSAEVRTDEAVDRGVILLGECPRCEHRWTLEAPTPRAPTRVLQAPATDREAATAA